MQNAKWNGGPFKQTSHDRATKLLDWACKQVEADAKRLVPIDTGHLMSSIHSLIDWSTMTGMVGTRVHYASYVEFGTWASRKPPFDSSRKGMKPRPFLRPALDILKLKLRKM